MRAGPEATTGGMNARFGLTLRRGAALVAGSTFLLTSSFGAVHVEQLRCEYLDNPLGIDQPQPRLSWVLESNERGVKQTAYQILVAGSEAALKKGTGDLWDSGKVASDETIQIRYGGPALASRQGVWWKVRVWDQDGRSAESNAARWEMGLLQPADWGAQWIGRTTDTNSNPAPLFRNAFSLDRKVKQARAYICGLGYYELYLNGKKVGDHLLDPGYTRYDKRALYVTYDVTDVLQRGQNAVGVMLGNGWYNCHTKAVWNFHEAPWRAAPKLLLQLRVDYADGTSQSLVSDGSWKCSTGPIVFDSIYGGETYDARLEKPGWDTAGYDDSRLGTGSGRGSPAGPAGRADDAAHQESRDAQARQAHRAQAGRLRLRHGPEPRRYGRAACSRPHRHARRDALRRAPRPRRHARHARTSSST